MRSAPLLALRTGTGEAIQGMFPLFFVLLFLSSMSLPRNLIESDWFRALATINPVSYLIEAIRSLIITGWDGQALALGFGIALLILALGLAGSPARCGEGWRGHECRRLGSVPVRGARRRLAQPAQLLHEPGADPAGVALPARSSSPAFAGGLSASRSVRGFDYAGDYTAFQFVFVLFQSAAFGGVFNAFSIARDFETGFARRLFLAAPNRIAVVAGYGLAALGRWAVHRFRPHRRRLRGQMDVGGSGIDLFGLYLLAALINMASTLFAAGVALRARTIQAGPAMQIPVFLVLFFAPVYVPLSLMADWIHAIATVNPITYVLEAGRGLISGDLAYIGLAFGLAVALIAGFAVWALRGLRKAEAAG